MKKGDGPLFHSVPIHIGDLKSEINDKDVQFLLDDLLGIINLYEEKNIDCTIFDTGFSKHLTSSTFVRPDRRTRTLLPGRTRHRPQHLPGNDGIRG